MDPRGIAGLGEPPCLATSRGQKRHADAERCTAHCLASPRGKLGHLVLPSASIPGVDTLGFTTGTVRPPTPFAKATEVFLLLGLQKSPPFIEGGMRQTTGLGLLGLFFLKQLAGALVWFLRQVLTMCSKLVWNSWSSCLDNAGMYRKEDTTACGMAQGWDKKAREHSSSKQLSSGAPGRPQAGF